MGVIRVRQNVLGESSVGVIAAFGDPLRRAGSWLAGSDLTYQTTRLRGDKNFLAGDWGLAMDRDDLAGRRHATDFMVHYPNDLWDVALASKWVGDSFDPSLGFVPRPVVTITTLTVTHQ